MQDDEDSPTELSDDPTEKACKLGIDKALSQRMSAQPVAAKPNRNRVGWFSGLFGRR